MAERMAEEAVRFFDRLVDLIPPEHYLPGDADTIALAKRAKHRHIDPESPAASTTGLQIEGKRQAGLRVRSDSDPPPSRTSLQQRLHERLVHLRAQRDASRKAQSSSQAKHFVSQRKRKRSANIHDDDGYNDDGVEQPREHAIPGGDNDKSECKEPADVSFNVQASDQTGEDASKGGARSVRGEGKLTNKKKLLNDAVERMQRVASDESAAEETAWHRSLERAKGEKVHDNPNLLKKSIKREQKKKQKSAEQWAERHRKQEEAQRKKQEKKRANLRQRANNKAARKIEKADKRKLRPGFEGRTQQTTLN
jgi:hypothetical protein